MIDAIEHLFPGNKRKAGICLFNGIKGVNEVFADIVKKPLVAQSYSES